MIEASLYSTVAPLLPHYREKFDLSTSAVGVLTGVYAAGAVIGALAGSMAARRVGPRRTVLMGLLMLAAFVLGFGLAKHIVVLDVFRFSQGIAAGVVWSGLLVWLLNAVPGVRRGRAIGTAMGAAVFGSIFGPVFGTVATATSPSGVFAAVAAMCVAIALWVSRLPSPPTQVRPATQWRRALSSHLFVGVTLICVLPGAIMGGLFAVVPLTLDAGGFAASAIGATFLVGAVIAATLSPLVGSASDRQGRLPWIRRGLVLTAPTLIALGLASSPATVAVLTVLAFGVTMTLWLVPLSALLPAVAEQTGVRSEVTASILIVTFSIGEMVGAPASAVLSDAVSGATPFVALACLVVVAFGWITAAASPASHTLEPVIQHPSAGS